MVIAPKPALDATDCRSKPQSPQPPPPPLDGGFGGNDVDEIFRVRSVAAASNAPRAKRARKHGLNASRSLIKRSPYWGLQGGHRSSTLRPNLGLNEKSPPHAKTRGETVSVASGM